MSYVKLYGADGSPYSMKVRAVLRYRRIPYLWIPTFQLGGQNASGPASMFQEHFPKIARNPVIPVISFTDGSYMNDSTFIIQELEERVKNDRHVIPRSNPVLAFLSSLIEDFGDEFCTKIMFEGRFHTDEDALFGASWQVEQNPKTAPITKASEMFAQRQRSRRSIVGSTNWDMLVDILQRICTILKNNVHSGNPFIFGEIPTNADFGIYGQFTQLVRDPLPSRIVYKTPAAWAWVHRMDDLSGLDVTPTSEIGITNAVKEFIQLICSVYIPFLRANEEAITTGKKSFSVPLLQGAYIHEQPTFKYQLKCLNELRKEYRSLHASEQAQVDELFREVSGSNEATKLLQASSKL